MGTGAGARSPDLLTQISAVPVVVGGRVPTPLLWTKVLGCRELRLTHVNPGGPGRGEAPRTMGQVQGWPGVGSRGKQGFSQAGERKGWRERVARSLEQLGEGQVHMGQQPHLLPARGPAHRSGIRDNSTEGEGQTAEGQGRVRASAQLGEGCPRGLMSRQEWAGSSMVPVSAGGAATPGTAGTARTEDSTAPGSRGLGRAGFPGSPARGLTEPPSGIRPHGRWPSSSGWRNPFATAGGLRARAPSRPAGEATLTVGPSFKVLAEEARTTWY